MNKVLFKEWGTFLGTRFLGEQCRQAIMKFTPENPVLLDFENVQGVSHSFTDECFGVIVSNTGLEKFKKTFEFQNLNPDVKAVLRFVLNERLNHLSN